MAKNTKFLLSAVVIASLATMVVAFVPVSPFTGRALAIPCANGSDAPTPPECPGGLTAQPGSDPASDAADAEAGKITAGQGIDASERCESAELNRSNCRIIDWIVIFINVLSSVAAVVIVASIIIGGMQYSSAGSDPQKVSSAKDRIRNAIIALLFFIFGYGLLNYLVPGGVL